MIAGGSPGIDTGFCNPFTSGSCIGKDLANLFAGAAGGPAEVPENRKLPHMAAQAAGSDAVSNLAAAIRNAIAAIVKDTVAWWVHVPSPCLAAARDVGCTAADPVPGLIQEWVFPFAAAVALTGFIVTGIRMALTRKAAPLADLGSGLLAMAVTSALATLLPTYLLKAGDAFSNWVLTVSTQGNFAGRFTELIAGGTLTDPEATGGLVIVLGIFAIIMATVQAILLLFRMGSVIILAGTLPLAASGQMTPLTRPWLKRQVGWTLALIFYKPAAALVYATGFALFGDGKSPEDILMGFAVLTLSLIALPVLMKFFTWTTGQMESSGGGMLSAVIGGAAAVGAVRGYGGGSSSAADQARALKDSMGPAGGDSGQGPSGAADGGPSGAPQSPGGSPAGGQKGGQGAGQAPAPPSGGDSPDSPGGGGSPGESPAGSPAGGQADPAQGASPGAADAAAAGQQGAGSAARAAAGSGGTGGTLAAGAAAGPAAGLIVLGKAAADGAGSAADKASGGPPDNGPDGAQHS